MATTVVYVVCLVRICGRAADVEWRLGIGCDLAARFADGRDTLVVEFEGR